MTSRVINCRQVLEGLSPETAWQDVASAVVEVRKAEAWRPEFESDSDWISAVAEATGHDPNTIRRYVASYRFLIQLADERGDFRLPQAKISALAAENLKRLHKIAPEEAYDALGKLEEGLYSARRLHERYQELKVQTDPPYRPNVSRGASTERHLFEQVQRDSKDMPAFDPFAGSGSVFASRGLRGRMAGPPPKGAWQFVSTALPFLNQSLKKRSPLPEGVEGEVSLYCRKYKLPFVVVEVVVIGRRDLEILFIDGYRFLPPSTGSVSRHVPEIALAATYFRRLWVVCGDVAMATTIADACGALGLTSIGVALAEGTKAMSFEVLLEPIGLPVPDRRRIAEREVARMGMPDL